MAKIAHQQRLEEIKSRRLWFLTRQPKAYRYEISGICADVAYLLSKLAESEQQVVTAGKPAEPQNVILKEWQQPVKDDRLSVPQWQSRPSAGYANIETEFEASLRRAFVDGRAACIVLDNRRQVFLGESVAYGIAQGWLTEELHQYDEQSSAVHCRLTMQGRQHFGLEVL